MLIASSKRKNNEKRKGHPLRRGIFLVAGLILLAISGSILLRPRFNLMTDGPTAKLVYSNLNTNTTYIVDFQAGERTVVDYTAPIYSDYTPSPNGKWMVVWQSALPQLNGWHLVLLDTETRSEPRTLATFSGAGMRPSWSPDGKWIAFDAYNFEEEFDLSTGGHPAELWMIHIETGELKRLTTNTYRDISPSFSPDGTQLAYVSEKYANGYPRIHIMDLATGESRLVTPDQYSHDPIWSPDGKWIAFEEYLHTDQEIPYIEIPTVYIVRADGAYAQSVSLDQASTEDLIGWRP